MVYLQKHHNTNNHETHFFSFFSQVSARCCSAHEVCCLILLDLSATLRGIFSNKFHGCKPRVLPSSEQPELLRYISAPAGHIEDANSSIVKVIMCPVWNTFKKTESSEEKKTKPQKNTGKISWKFLSPFLLTHVCVFFGCLNFMPVGKQNAGWRNWFWWTWQPSFGTPWLPWRCLRNPTSYNLRQNVSG